jgi:hypothetical protein
MPQTFFIKPAREGLIVRDPATRIPLAPSGEEKPHNAFWLRREADKDVVECSPPAEPANKKPAGGDKP